MKKVVLRWMDNIGLVLILIPLLAIALVCVSIKTLKVEFLGLIRG